MSEEKVYPAFYEDKYGDVYMCTTKSNHYAMDVGAWSNGEYEEEHKTDTNITNQYLANTYGEVLSPEHAEFIIELAENTRCAGVDICKAKTKLYNVSGMYFNFYIDNGVLWLSFHNLEMASNRGEKQITIPLPPKQIQTATPEEEFEMAQIEKNNGDNLILGCEQDFKVAREIVTELREEANCSDESPAKCKEWRCVGSVVTWGNKSVKGEVKALSDGLAWIKNEYGNYCTEYVASLIKPKTPEEELRDEIELIFRSFSGNPAILIGRHRELAIKFIKDFNITKKPQ